MRTRLLLATWIACVMSTALVVSAQDEGDDTEEETPAAPAAPTGPPTATGRSDVAAQVDRQGRILELHSKARIVIPPNLPVAARRVRFAELRDRIDAAAVAAGFQRIGSVYSFDGAINATEAPVEVSIVSPRDPARRGARLVLAMETPTICRAGLPPLPGASAGLCSGWELLPARWDATDHRLSARMATPGGYRLMFGTVPCAEGERTEGCPQPTESLPPLQL